MTPRNVGFFSDVKTHYYYPSEMIEEIYLRMPLKDIISTIPTSQTTAFVGRSDSLFKKLFKKHFGVDINSNCMQKFALYYQFNNALTKIIVADSNRKVTDQLLNNFIKHYNQLTEFVEHSTDPADNSWTSHLLGRFIAEEFRSDKIKKHQPKDHIDKGTSLLMTAANLGNPFSMLEIINYMLFTSRYISEPDEMQKLEDKVKFWREKALHVGSECPNLIYMFAEHFEHEITTQSFELLIKAAKAGHTEAAYKLANRYLSSEIPTPMNSADWMALKFIELCEANTSTYETEFDELLQLANNGSAIAADYIVNTYTIAQANKAANKIAARQYRDLRDTYEMACLPERRERAIYWLKEAAKDGHENAIKDLKMIENKESITKTSGPRI